MGNYLREGEMSDDWQDAPFTALREHWKESARKQPDYRTDLEKALLSEMFAAYDKLRSLGWRDIIYCPKDGTRFLAITAGSTGICPHYYQGEWPKVSWWAEDAGDLWPSRPILWRPMP